VDEKVTGSIDQGFLVLIGVSDTDDEKTADRMVAKMLKLRIFEDENGKTNLDLKTVGGSLLLISQFTLYGDVRRGRRPSFTNAMNFAEATELYDYFNEELRKRNLRVETGIFGAEMKVSLINDGPVTILLDTEDLIGK
jgi:D-tyrosyl-tRNA(Tyr) deacylase